MKRALRLDTPGRTHLESTWQAVGDRPSRGHLVLAQMATAALLACARVVENTRTLRPTQAGDQACPDCFTWAATAYRRTP